MKTGVNSYSFRRLVKSGLTALAVSRRDLGFEYWSQAWMSRRQARSLAESKEECTE